MIGDSIQLQAASGAFTSLNFEHLDSNAAIDSDVTVDDLRISYNDSQIDVLNQYAGGEDADLISFGSGTYLGYALAGGDYNLITDTSSPLGGGPGQDVIASTSATQTLTGAGGNDLLFGNGGDDIANGQTGNDLRVGGTGFDSFVFAGGDSG